MSTNRLTRTLIKMGRALSPSSSKAVRIFLVALIVIATLMEIDQGYATAEKAGPVYRMWSWIWNNVLAYKAINIAIGGITVYVFMRHQEKKRSSGIRASVFKKATLNLSIAELERSAREHGIELNLMDDPRISRRNPGAMPNTREMPDTGKPQAPPEPPKEPPKP